MSVQKSFMISLNAGSIARNVKIEVYGGKLYTRTQHVKNKIVKVMEVLNQGWN